MQREESFYAEEMSISMAYSMNRYLSYIDTVLEANYIETLKYKQKSYVDLDIVFEAPSATIDYCTKVEDIRPLRPFPISTAACFHLDVNYDYNCPSSLLFEEEAKKKEKEKKNKIPKHNNTNKYYWIAHPIVYILKETHCPVDNLPLLISVFDKVGITLNDNDFHQILKPVKSFLNSINIKIKNPANLYENFFCIICRTFMCPTHFHKKNKNIYRLCLLPTKKSKFQDAIPTIQIQCSQCTTVELLSAERNTPFKNIYATNLKKYIPCGGEICKANFGFCDIYCQSFNKFKGCHCSSCDKNCPCYAKFRECNPQVCNYKNFTHNCLNMSMFLNRKIKLLLGKSTICNGYGLFAGKRINNGQFIGEYKGELIWRGEEYIRSQICQAEKKTYLFPTNDEETIDGIMFGCKTRYINHSKKPNCSAVMLRSSGQDKIGIFAQACIYKQEELFLDYGKNIDSEFS